MEYQYVKTANGDLIKQQVAALGLPSYRWTNLSLDAIGTQGVIVAVDGELSVPQKAILDATIAAHNAAHLTAAQQAALDAETARTAARATLVTTAQGAVGQTPLNWTNNQFRAIVALLVWESGGLNGDTTLRPLNQWLKP
jgi:hypothetical protein